VRTPQPTGYPVHLNGHFEVHSSRQRITTGDDEGRQIRWNDLLLKHAVATAYVELLDSLRSSIRETATQSWYSLWPKTTAEPLVRNVYAGLAKRTTIWTRKGELFAWSKISDVLLPPSDRREELQKPLLCIGASLPEPPLSATILDGFKQADVVLHELNPGALRKLLRGNSRPPPSDLVRPLLAFCLADDKQDLSGLPLALLANDEVQTFGQKKIYLATEEQIAIFPDLRSFFLDPALKREFKVKEDQNTKLVTLTPEKAVTVLQKYSRSTDREWVRRVLRYLANNKQLNFRNNELLESAKKTPLIPDRFWNLHTANSLTTPLLWRTDIDQSLLTALNTLSVPLIPDDEEIRETLVTLRQHHPNLIYELTAADLIDTLSEIEPTWRQPEADIILDFLADDGTLLRDENRINLLQHLPLLPTTNGDLVAAVTPGVFLPGGFESPFHSTTIRLLKFGGGEQRQTLYRRLGLQTMTLSSYVRTVLLKSSDITSVPVLRWLADHYSQLDDEARRALRAAPLARAKDENHYPAQEVYASEVVSELLPAGVRWLDNSALGSDPGGLLRFFRDLELRDRPSAEDLLARIKEILSSTDAEKREESENILGRICEYISSQWGYLSKNSLAEKLSNLEWLPALRQPRQQAIIGFVPRQTRLFRPRDLYFADRIHLIGSQAPLCSLNLDTKFRKDLGFCTDLQLEMVLNHFAHLLDLYDEQPEDRSRTQQIARSLREIYQFIGQRCGGKKEESERVQQRFGQRRCIWIEETGRLWAPMHVFSVSVGYLHPWRAWLSEANQGLDVLGRRREPDIEDLCAVLDEIASTKESSLSSLDRETTLRILRHVYEMPGEIRPDVKVLTEQRHLAPAPSVYVDDAPWRRLLVEKAGLLLLDADVSRAFPDIDKRTGVRRLSSCLVEVLSCELVGTQDEDAIRRAYLLEDRLHTPAFIQGVRRLIQFQGVVKSELGWIGKLHVMALDKVIVDCHLTNPEVALGPAEDDMFFDAQKNVLYVAAHQVRRMPLFVARALSRQLGAVEQEPLKAMLECDLDDIAEELDVRRILPIPASEDEIPVWFQTRKDELAPTEGEDASQAPKSTDALDQGTERTPDEDAGDVQDESAEDEDAEPRSPSVAQSRSPTGSLGMTSPFPSSGGIPGARRFLPPVGTEAGAVRETVSSSPPDHQSADETGPQILRPTPPSESGVGISSAGPPLAPGDGTSHVPRGEPRGRLRSYAIPVEPFGTPNTGEQRETTTELNRAAVQKVLRDAHDCGWSAEEAGPTDRGFDVKLEVPGESDPRFVVAKGLRSAWDGTGVALTKDEFREAHERGEMYWLTIVEYVLDPAKAQATPIQALWNKLDEVRFDDGWREVSASRPLVQPMEGATLYEGDVRIGEIRKVTPMLPMLRLHVETSEGSTRSIFYNPSQHRVVLAEKTDGTTNP